MAKIDDEDRAQLTAYLDGEMDDEAAVAFEARLAREPRLRAECDALKKTWDLLDYLPRPEPSPTFTHRTLERLSVVETGKQTAVAPSSWAWIAPVGWAAAMLLAMGAGLFAAHQIWPPVQPPPPANPGPQQNASREELEAKIVENLGPIENFRVYNHVVDLEFARKLAEAMGEEEGGS